MIIFLCVFISAQYEYIYAGFFFGLVRSNYGTGFGARLAGGVGWPALGGFMMSPTIICSAATASTTAEALAGADCARAGGQRHYYKHTQQLQNAI